MATLADGLILGVVEGLTEFLPVSSTGHLILVGEVLGFTGPPGRLFEITIQLGAILAICVLYAARLTRLALALPREPAARRVFLALLIGFLPAAVIGLIAHDFITSVLFSPYVVCVSLVLGGIAILLIERYRPPMRYHDIGEISPALALKIGLCQTLAMIPGVSRSGATILGAVLLGVERRAAAEYSFLLAIPTMLGAAAVSLSSHWEGVDRDGALLVALGFATAFLSALLVVSWLLAWISRHDFRPFGWYRIAIGSLMFAVLMFG